MFGGKTVYICFDVDAAGRRGAVKRAKELYQFTKCVYILDLPLPSTEYPHGGIDDYFTKFRATSEDFAKLVEGCKPWQPQQIREIDLDETVYETTLGRATSK